MDEQIATLLGVLVGLIAALVPLFFQLRHDSEEREKQRIFDNRIDIYLNTIENFSIAEQYFLDLAFQGEVLDKTLSIRSYISSTRKINLIGTNETLVSSNNLMKAFTMALHNLNPLLKRHSDIQDRIDALNLVLLELKPQLTHFSVELNDALNKPNPDIDVVNDLRHQHGLRFNQNQQVLQEIQSLLDAKKEILNEMKKFGAEQVMIISDSMPSVIFSIRRELNLDLNEEEYMEYFNENKSKAKSILETYCSE